MQPTMVYFYFLQSGWAVLKTGCYSSLLATEVKKIHKMSP